MKIIIGLACALMLLSGCEESPLVEVKIIQVQDKYLDEGWYARFPHTTVERQDTKERVQIQGTTFGKTGEVFMMRSNAIRWTN